MEKMIFCGNFLTVFVIFKSMIGYIYLIIDLTNLKKYVGQHHYHLEKLDSNYHGSGTIISKIYKKRPHTLKEVYLKTCYTQEELDEWEQYYINFYNTLSPNGYNLQEGGRGGLPSDETRRKMSDSHKGLCTGEKHPMFGKHHSEESKKKMSQNHYDCSGEKNPMFGKHLSEETKKKMSLSKKGKPNLKLSKQILQFTLDGEFIREWPSAAECGRNGFDRNVIRLCCQGKYKQAYGFKWCYA